MIKGILHAHSEYSYDAFDSLEFIAKWAVSEGLNFVVLTEHDNDFDDEKFERYFEECNRVSILHNIIILPGIEYSFAPKGKMHINILGIDHFIQKDFPEQHLEQFLDYVHQLDGLAILNHPLMIIDHVALDVMKRLDGFEVWNTKYDLQYSPNMTNVRSFKKFKNYNDRGIRAIASSDIHTFPPHTFVTMNLSTSLENLDSKAILGCLRKGDFHTEYNGWTISSSGKIEKSLWANWILMNLSALHQTAYFLIRNIARSLNYKPPSKLVKLLRFKK